MYVIFVSVWNGIFNRFTYETFQKSMKHPGFSIKVLLYSVLFSNVHSLHTLGTKSCLVLSSGWEKILPQKQQGRLLQNIQETYAVSTVNCSVSYLNV